MIFALAFRRPSGGGAGGWAVGRPPGRGAGGGWWIWSPRNMGDWIGRTLSKVRIERLLGRGGMAEVYLGLHTTLNRNVAVKILHGHLSGDPNLLQRFRAEAQAVAGFRHPN